MKQRGRLQQVHLEDDGEFIWIMTTPLIRGILAASRGRGVDATVVRSLVRVRLGLFELQHGDKKSLFAARRRMFAGKLILL